MVEMVCIGKNRFNSSYLSNLGYTEYIPTIQQWLLGFGSDLCCNKNFLDSSEKKA